MNTNHNSPETRFSKTKDPVCTTAETLRYIQPPGSRHRA